MDTGRLSPERTLLVCFFPCFELMIINSALLQVPTIAQLRVASTTSPLAQTYGSSSFLTVLHLSKVYVACVTSVVRFKLKHLSVGYYSSGRGRRVQGPRRARFLQPGSLLRKYFPVIDFPAGLSCDFSCQQGGAGNELTEDLNPPTGNIILASHDNIYAPGGM